jgi:anti-anti-sigma factor
VEGEKIGGVNAPTLTEEMLVDLAAATRAVNDASPHEPFEQVVARMIGDAARAVKADRAAMWLHRGDVIEVVATTGLRATTVDRFLFVDVAPDTPGEELLRRRNPVTWTTHEQAQRYFPVVSIDDLGSGYVSPLYVGDTFSGVLFVGWRQQHRTIRSAERVFLEGVTQCCALAVQRSDAEEELVGADYDEIIVVSDTFSVKLTRSAGHSIAWIAGEIDFANDKELEDALQAIVRRKTRETLAFDLANVEFLSVAAARVIVAACEQPSAYANVAIVNASPAARRVLDLLADDTNH